MASLCYIGNDKNIGCTDLEETERKEVPTCQEDKVVEKMHQDNNTIICPNGRGCLPLQVDRNDGEGCVYNEECKQKNNKICGFGKVNAGDCSGACVPKTRYEVSVRKALMFVILFSITVSLLIYYFTFETKIDSVTNTFNSFVNQLTNNKTVADAVGQVSNSKVLEQISNSKVVEQISNSKVLTENAVVDKVKSSSVFNFIENMISKSVKKVAEESKNLTK
jgi:hypothetical protein